MEKHLEIASAAAKRRFGERATVMVEETPPSYPPRCRWHASARVRGGIVFSRWASRPGVATKLLADALMAMIAQQARADRQLFDLARAG